MAGWQGLEGPDLGVWVSGMQGGRWVGREMGGPQTQEGFQLHFILINTQRYNRHFKGGDLEPITHGHAVPVNCSPHSKQGGSLCPVWPSRS